MVVVRLVEVDVTAVEVLYVSGNYFRVPVKDHDLKFVFYGKEVQWLMVSFVGAVTQNEE